jgi:flavodoxin
MSTSGTRRRLSAAVLFASRFGTTEIVAKAFERGLRDAGMDTFCARTSEVAPGSLQNYDLVCVGGPTEVLSATRQMKDFLKAMGTSDFEGRFGFAFDTKLDSRLSGSAAKYIEHALDDKGLHMIARRESAIVTTRKEGGRIVGADLRQGEEERFEELGARVAKATEDAREKVQGGAGRQG